MSSLDHDSCADLFAFFACGLQAQATPGEGVRAPEHRLQKLQEVRTKIRSLEQKSVEGRKPRESDGLSFAGLTPTEAAMLAQHKQKEARLAETEEAFAHSAIPQSCGHHS